MVELKEPHCVSSFNIQFQGGFVGQDCKIELKSDDQVLIEPFYPEDVNSVQKFLLSKPTICNKIKFLFNNSTDFFGRIVVYSIDILV